MTPTIMLARSVTVGYGSRQLGHLTHLLARQEPIIARVPVDERRDRLVAAAFRVVAEHSVDAATTRRICAEAGMSLASFHYAFDSRAALLEALVVAGLSSEDTAVHAVLTTPDGAPSADPTDRPDIDDLLRGGLTGYLDSLVADPAREQAMMALARYARRTPGLEALAARTYERYYQLAARALTAATEVSGRRWRTPPEELAPIVVAATDGLTVAYLTTGDLVNARRIVDACVTVLLTHLEPA
ncbi:TetR/AcrR family transcriptional regulator [Williamsia herbipolensis]|uniref:TetR/AcrR family transcriptional regulator n=1 Tax=Williamsia herbipolensis TaxID=1603258 RepID=UPI000B0F3514|nr:TetR/AcrR family transcriptional regulator [Williamsia herbipolensis]